jgi:hypothetical protein
LAFVRKCSFTYDEVRQSTADGEDQHMEKEKKVAKGIAKSEIKRTLFGFINVIVAIYKLLLIQYLF